METLGIQILQGAIFAGSAIFFVFGAFAAALCYQEMMQFRGEEEL